MIQMKFNQQSVFNPINIQLETLEEARAVLALCGKVTGPQFSSRQHTSKIYSYLFEVLKEDGKIVPATGQVKFEDGNKRWYE